METTGLYINRFLKGIGQMVGPETQLHNKENQCTYGIQTLLHNKRVRLISIIHKALHWLQRPKNEKQLKPLHSTEQQKQ